MEGKDAKDMNAKLVDAELKIWKKVEDIAYAEGKHPDEVYADLMIQFSEFIENQYTDEEYPDEKSAKERIKQARIKQARIKKQSNNTNIC
jgi:hypothetical protein